MCIPVPVLPSFDSGVKETVRKNVVQRVTPEEQLPCLQLSHQWGIIIRNETRANLSLYFSFSSDFVNFQMIKEYYFSAIWAVLYHFYHLSKVVVEI